MNQVRASHILVDNEATAKDLKAKIEEGFLRRNGTRTQLMSVEGKRRRSGLVWPRPNG